MKLTKKNIEEAKRPALAKAAKKAGLKTTSRKKEDLQKMLHTYRSASAKAKKIIASDELSKSEKARRLRAAGIDSPTTIARLVDMHPQHVHSAWKQASKAAKKDLAA